MCLISKTDTARVAEHDIRVYKCLSLRLHYTGKTYDYNTLPLYFSVSGPSAAGLEEFRAEGGRSVESTTGGCFEIGRGFIHTFANFNDAVQYMDLYRGTPENFPAVFEAAIPAGAEYFEGVHYSSATEQNIASYASDRIVLGGMLKCRVRCKDYNSVSECKETRQAEPSEE